jgi:hypothetical protein
MDPFSEICKMVVNKIVDEDGRILLYPVDERYHVIAPSKRESEVMRTIQKGDVIEYETCGVNFGWFLRKLPNGNR